MGRSKQRKPAGAGSKLTPRGEAAAAELGGSGNRGWKQGRAAGGWTKRARRQALVPDLANQDGGGLGAEAEDGGGVDLDWTSMAGGAMVGDDGAAGWLGLLAPWSSGSCEREM